MIRLLNAYFPRRVLFLGISEGCLIALSFVAAATVRLGTNDATLMLQYEQGFSKILILSGAFLICMYYFDLYDSSILSNQREVFTRLVQALGSMCILVAVIYYFYPPLELGRGIILIGLTMVAITLALWRGLFSALNRRPRFAERTMIFGDEPSASRLFRELESRPELGLSVVVRVLVDGNGTYEMNCERRSLTSTSDGRITREELPTAIGLQRVNRIIVSLDERRGRLPVELLLSMKSQGVYVQDGTEFYEQITGKLPIESLRLGTLLFSSGFRVSRFLVIYKRASSVVVSIVGLVLCLPFLPFVALAIKLTSPGRLLYHQKRVGRNGAVFYCHKFRTMRADAEADTGPTWAGDEDPRITSVGRFLRTTRLDEIPQLWNVLKGEMSLVGPRPERPEFVEWLKKEIPHFHLRHTVRPGITGWAQIRYKYGSSVEDAKEKLRYDLFYIKHLSPGLDVLIFFQTVKIILLGRGAR
ncbi:MAG TPA: TIGR03013 family XrtA/PEP-CTERM system glycosyltransferase [Candidatus Acidoferrum sp.]|nr:TIGR03013 family XrtA/PEP-CTERM system glycosyltransferase [Candidatus Acidoferrum sp.]